MISSSLLMFLNDLKVIFFLQTSSSLMVILSVIASLSSSSFLPSTSDHSLINFLFVLFAHPLMHTVSSPFPILYFLIFPPFMCFFAFFVTELGKSSKFLRRFSGEKFYLRKVNYSPRKILGCIYIEKKQFSTLKFYEANFTMKF